MGASFGMLSPVKKVRPNILSRLHVLFNPLTELQVYIHDPLPNHFLIVAFRTENRDGTANGDGYWENEDAPKNQCHQHGEPDYREGIQWRPLCSFQGRSVLNVIQIVLCHNSYTGNL